MISTRSSGCGVLGSTSWRACGSWAASAWPAALPAVWSASPTSTCTGTTRVARLAAGKSGTRPAASISAAVARTTAKILGFATGGQVPGTGSGDTVAAILTPGEVVMNKASKAYAPLLSVLNASYGGAAFASSQQARPADGGLAARQAGAGLFPSAAEIGAAVAAAVLHHARTTPKLTLGVVAFSTVQRQAIQDALEVGLRQHPELQAFFNRHPHEPFFIKNLENVQGDERDVILISIGYGRTKDGYLSMSFGPLSGEGGERRLNVLITRAKQRCEIFTNLTADDLDVSRVKHAKGGVAALKMFLEFAQHGRLSQNIETGREMDSPFEEAVFRALTARGHTVRPQVGSQGFFIDLAVVDPDQPGRYALGIECDGAMYHSARSARDRDRLRQGVLEAVGWHLHRIWSTDWFRDPVRETDRAEQAIAEARRRHALDQPDQPDELEEPEEVSEVTEDLHAGFAREAAAPELLVASAVAYQLARLPDTIAHQELHLHPPGQLANWVTEVVRVESPVHPDDVARRLGQAAGATQVGRRMRASIDTAIRMATALQTVRQQDGFLWDALAPGTGLPLPRDRSALPAGWRKLALIAPQELAQTALYVVRQSFAIEREAVAGPAAKLLGFVRLVGDEPRQLFEEAIQHLLSTNQVTDTNGVLRPVE